MLSKYKKYLTALGVATGLVFTTTPAHAGFIAPIIGAVATALGIGTVAATIVTVVAAVAVVAAVGYAVQAMTPSFDVPDYSTNTADGAESVNTGILVNKAGTNKPIPVVYGYRRIGGNRVYVSTDGTNNEDLYIAMVFCEGEINAFKKLIIDDKLVAEGSSLTNQIDNNIYNKEGRLVYELQRGASGQTPPSFFTSGAPGWTSNHKLSGLAVGYFKCKWIRPNIDDPAADQQTTADENPFGGIPKIQVEVEGKKDPNANSFTDSSTTAYSSMTLAYSRNPADHMLDYLMNPTYGRGLDHTRIGFTSFSTAKTKFNTTVNYATGGTGPILEFNYVVSTSRTMLENTQTLLQNMRSGMPYIQGRFNLKLLDTGHASNPTSTPTDFVSVGEDKIIGGITLEGKGHRDQYNQVKAVFSNPNTNWELDEVVYPEVGSATDNTFLAEDNNKRLVKEISLEGVTNENIAGDIASIVLLRSRKKKAISFKATAELHDVVVGDLLKITYPSLGMTDSQFRVTSHQITADYEIQITALEHNHNDYDFTNTDVYLPSGVNVSSNNQNQNGGQVSPGNPYFPGPQDQNANISSISHIVLKIFELTINAPSDVSQYDFLRVDQFNGGSSTPVRNPSNIFSRTYQKFGSNFNNQPSFEAEATNKPKIYFRVVYIKRDNSEVVGPWKGVTNPNAGNVSVSP